MLYTPESHEPIESRPWDPDVALTTIREIAADCEASFESPYWPVHPRDDDGTGPYATLYEGPSGVIYALDLLCRPRPRRYDSRLCSGPRAAGRGVPRET